MPQEQHGPPKAYKTPAIFKRKAIEYFKHCTETGEIPFLVGFAVFTQVPLYTLEAYRKYEGYEDYYQMIKDASHHTILQGGLKKEFSDKTVALILRNHNGYVGESQITKTEAPTQPQTHTVELVLAQPPEPAE